MKKRLTYIDLINVIAIFAVLVIHSSWNYDFTPLGTFDYTIKPVAKFAVFVLLMNSGATLIGYRSKYSTSVFFKKRLIRILIPLIFWSIVFYLVAGYSHSALPNAVYLVDHMSVPNFIKLFMSARINSAFWFFYLIITLYLLTPVLSALAEKYKDVLFYIVALDFVLNFVVVFVNNTYLHLQLPAYALALTGETYIGFFVMGYLIHQNYFNEKQIKLFKLLGVGSLVLCIAFPLLRTIFPAEIVQNSVGYGGPFNFFYSIAVFIYLKEWAEKGAIFKKEKVQHYLAVFSSFTYGIYIVHPFFMKIFMWATHTIYDSWLDILFMPTFTYVGAAMVAFCFKKVPYLNKLM